MKSVYLGGTISPAPEHLEWRKRVKEWAETRSGWVGVDPINWKMGLIRLDPPKCLVIDPTDRNDMRNVSEDGLHDRTMPDSLFVRADIADIERVDVVMVVYWRERCRDAYGDCTIEQHHRRRQSIGTWGEMLLAHYLHKPIIVVTDDPSVADHPFTKECAAAIESTIEKGLERLEVLVR